MVDTELFDLFPKQNIDKQVEITYSGGTITNSELFSESMELTESLCSESELRFGSCEASQIKFKIANVFLPMFGQEITVQMKLEDHHDTPFQIGRYKVVSDTPTADRRWRDIVAYDAMQDIIDANVAAWYNEILPNTESQVSMSEFRKKFLEHFGIVESDPEQVLVNDDMIVQRTIEPEQLSGKDVITAICEINACFGHINREGKFAYIYLPQYIQGLYPANDLYPDHAPDYLPYQQETGHLYPQNPKGVPIGKNGTYISCKYEDFITKEIKRLQIRKEENDIGVIVNENKEWNTYIIQDNFLVYGKGTEELKKIAENIFSKISGIIYRPYNAEVQGNLCLEVGDPIRFSTKYDIVESYVLERTLKGIQALRDSFSANGTEVYSENLNSTHNSIVELRGKSNVLTRTIEETKSDLRDTEQNLRSTITQTASEIRSEVEKADEGLSSRITQNATNITAEVTRATGAEGTLSASIQVNANAITQKVSKGSVSSEISQEAGKIKIQSNRLSISSTYFNLSEDGTINASNGTFSGSVSANTGTFNNVTINDNCTVAGQSIRGTIGNSVGWNGSAIQNDYIGNLNAGKLTSGTVGVGYSYGSTSINTTGISSSSSSDYFQGIQINNRITATRNTSSGSTATVGTSSLPFQAMYAGSFNNGSSIETKTNIKEKEKKECLDTVLATNIYSYQYKTDTEDKSKLISEMKRKRTNFVKNAIRNKTKTDTGYEQSLMAFDEEIEALKKEPEVRYGFISEEAPEELVSNDKKSVNLYSCIAMLFGAVQEQQREIDELKKLVSESEGNKNGNAESA